MTEAQPIILAQTDRRIRVNRVVFKQNVYPVQIETIQEVHVDLLRDQQGYYCLVPCGSKTVAVRPHQTGSTAQNIPLYDLDNAWNNHTITEWGLMVIPPQVRFGTATIIKNNS